MLVLSRQRDEEIIIQLENGELITFAIVDIRGDKVRVGITARTAIAVHRREVFEAIERERARAAERLAGSEGATDDRPAPRPDAPLSPGPNYIGPEVMPDPT